MSLVVSKLMVDAILQTSIDGFVAHAGGGQAQATQIPYIGVARITTVANPFDSIVLPPAIGGFDILVINHDANVMQVFGQPGDTIDDIAATIGVPQMVDGVVLYTCVTPGKWYTTGLAAGYARGVPGQFATESSADNLVAHAGGGQGSATPITTMIALFGTVATIGDSALLPISKPGMNVTVINKTANSMNVFPQVGDQINGTAANTALAVAGGTTTIFFVGTAGAWWTK